MRSNLSALLAVMLAVSAASTPAPGASFQGLGDLPGGAFQSAANGVSADGSVVVGFGRSASGQEAFRWTSGGGMIGLGDLPGGTFESSAFGVSSDGSVVVGYGYPGPEQEAFRWTSAGGMVGLGDLPGGIFISVALGVSADGSVVVGRGNSASGSYGEAFRWTSDGGMVGLGDLPGGSFNSEATAVSADGSVVVGSGYSGAFRWTSGGGMVGLGGDHATAVSADGSVVVGGYSQAFRWTSSSGIVRLGEFESFARGVSGDGSVIVGRQGSFAPGYEAFRWTSDTGMERLWDVLLAEGIDPAADGWTTLTGAQAISADGNTIVGYGTRNGNMEAFVAVVPVELPGDFNHDGAVDAADYIVWRKNGGGPQAYDTWRANFGSSLGPGSGSAGYPLGASAEPLSANVPEPATLALLIFAAASRPLRCRRITV